MKVTPTKKKFGKYAVGDVFELPSRTAKVFIKVGTLAEVIDAPALTAATNKYSTRMMQAAPASLHTVSAEALAQTAAIAPYGYKADGTPRLRPGRPAKSE